MNVSNSSSPWRSVVSDCQAYITNILLGVDKQTEQTVFHFKPPSLYCAFMLVLFTFCFYIMGLSRTSLLIIPISFFQPVSLQMLFILSSAGVSDQKEEVFVG